MNEPPKSAGASGPDPELARERTRQANVVGWTVGLTAIAAVSTLASHPTWPFAAGVVAVAAMMAVVCRGILKIHFETWWQARATIARGAIRAVLILVLLAGLLVFFGFKFQRAYSSKRESTELEIGLIQPWFHWEQVKETTETSSGGSRSFSMNFHNSSGFNFFTLSFGAGVMVMLSAAGLGRIRAWEKMTQAPKA